MRNLFFAIAFAVAPVASASAGPVEDYEELREEIWDAALDAAPLLATSVGDARGAGRLADLSLAEYERRLAQRRAFLARLRAIDAAALPDELRIDYEILETSLADRIEASAHDHDRYVLFTTFGGWASGFASLPDRSPFFDRSDYASYVDRLRAFAAQNEAGIARSREAVARGLTQPCGPLGGFGERIAMQVAEDYRETPFWKPFAGERPAFLEREAWTALKAEARAAIEQAVIPAYADFLRFYTKEYAPACRTGTPGVLATPGGKEYYAYRVRSFTTTTDMTPDEVHRLGLAEVARIRAEMERVAEGAGFASRAAFIEHLRTDPQYFMTDAEDYVEHVAALAKHIDGFLPKLFGRLPRQPYTVKPIPIAQAPGNTTAYYESGSLETGQAG
ncbi:MAG: DUF885 domain-containing protein, partial [Erythrobacter sp.]